MRADHLEITAHILIKGREGTEERATGSSLPSLLHLILVIFFSVCPVSPFPTYVITTPVTHSMY